MYNLIHNLAILQTSHFHFKVYNSCKVPEDLAKEVLIILNEINKFDRTQVFQIHCCISGDVADIWFNFVFIQGIVHTSCLHVHAWKTTFKRHEYAWFESLFLVSYMYSDV